MAKPTKMITVTYPQDGPVEELRGESFTIPNSIVNKRDYIESAWREESARKAAEMEAEQRDQQVLADRVKQQKANDQQRLADLETTVVMLLDENKALKAQIDGMAPPADMEKLSEINAQTTLAMGRTYDAGLEVARQQERTEELLATDSEHRNQWADLKEQTLAVSRNQLTFWNEAQAAAGQQIQLRDEQIAKEQEHSKGLSEQIGQNWQLVEAASKLNEASIEQQEQRLQRAIDETRETLTDEFVAMMNLALGALGIDQAVLDMHANQIDMQPTQALRLTRRQISQYSEIYRKSQKAVADAEARTDAAMGTGSR